MTGAERLAQRGRDLASWARLSEAQRRDFVAWNAQRPAEDRLSVDEWAAELRLASQPPPWEGLIEEHVRAAAVEAENRKYIVERRHKLELLEEQHAQIADDYVKRDEAAALQKQIAAETRELRRLEALDAVELYRAIAARSAADVEAATERAQRMGRQPEEAAWPPPADGSADQPADPEEQRAMDRYLEAKQARGVAAKAFARVGEDY